MIISRNKPVEDAEKRIFTQDAPLLVALGFLAVVFQLVSGFTEFLGLKEVLTPPLGALYGKIAAFLVAFSLEYAILFLVVYIVNAIYDGYLYSSEYNKRQIISNKIKFALMAILLTGLVWVSIFLSKENTRAVLKSNPIVNTEDIGKYEAQQYAHLEKISERYKEDLSLLEEDRNNALSSLSEKWEAMQNQKLLEIRKYEQLEAAGGNRYISAKNNIQKQIQKQKELQASEKIALQEHYAQNRKKLQEKMDTETKQLTTLAAKKVGVLEEKNYKKEKLNDKIVDFITAYAQYAVVIFLVVTTWICLSLNTAGIRPKVYIKPEMLEGSLIQEIYLLITTSISRPLRNMVRRNLKKIAPLEEIQEGAVISVDTKVIQLPLPYKKPKVANAAADKNVAYIKHDIYEPVLSENPEVFESSKITADSDSDSDSKNVLLPKEEIQARIKILEKGISSYQWKLRNNYGKKETATRNIEERKQKIKELKKMKAK